MNNTHELELDVDETEAIGTAADGAELPRDRFSMMASPTTSHEARSQLVDLLRRDLVGPHPDHDPDLQREVLGETTPSTWYLTGFIAPDRDAPEVDLPPEAATEEAGEQGIDEQRETETFEETADASGRPDDEPTERPRRSFMPSSIGLTVLVPEEATQLSVRVTWGDYRAQPPLNEALFLPERVSELEPGEIREAGPASERTWHRVPHEERVSVPIAEGEREFLLPGSSTPGRAGADALVLVVRARAVLDVPQPDGTLRRARAISVFLVNRRFRVVRKFADVANAHQVRLELECDAGFEPTVDRSRYGADDPDERLADLHYRDECAFGVGHNTSVDWSEDEGSGRRVWTDPLPCHEVPGMRADIEVEGVERSMEALAEAAAAPTADALAAMLQDLPTAYTAWARAQQAVLSKLPERRQETAQTCLDAIETARARIEGGIQRLKGDRTSRRAFAIMNRVIARSNRQRTAALRGEQPDQVRPPSWRLFQLAFVLLNLDGLADREHPDRPVVDLLFFPTGGGKTEAYLGLAAFAIARRRLDNPGLTGSGLSVVMRYTLRLLTLDQLARAAGLVCALELERQQSADLGDWPIEIGLWVGGRATPNRLGGGKNAGEGTLVKWLRDYKRQPNRNASPLPIKDCPWCGHAIEPDSFSCHPNSNAPQRLDVTCVDDACAFSQQRLPIVAVDEEIYRRLPSFMIATVDKFANVAWEGAAGAFFGHVDRRDNTGFYGAAEPNAGTRLERELSPIDLIIQDELHLISGPLGTVAGLYETAFDLLSSRTVNERRIGPKIVASTATVRRARSQIAALFGRSETHIFPPPGPTRHDSFFARTENEHPGRLYLGVGAPGQGPKRVFLRALQTLLAGAAALSNGTENDPTDPYLTALCYFNALRELGGARRIVDDEVRRNLSNYGERRVRVEPTGQPFRSRPSNGGPGFNQLVELTSRVSTDDVADARKRLGQPASDRKSAHVALATNMISVGLDIGRLGLMLVQGQPKTTAEYIQATSRVGREAHKPGLVVALLNLHKPRDRAHYEQFRAFHASFYRAVEASTVTPFAPRALDRALAAALVTGARHIEAAMTPRSAAEHVGDHPASIEQFVEVLSERLRTCEVDQYDTERVLERLGELSVAWEEIAQAQTAEGGEFVYDRAAQPQRLLQDALKPLDSDLDERRSWFEAGRSMRDTEPASLLKLRRPDGSSFVRERA